jgi:hypothetical protein
MKNQTKVSGPAAGLMESQTRSRARLERNGLQWLVIDARFNTVILMTTSHSIAQEWQRIANICEHPRPYDILEHYPQGHPLAPEPKNKG